MLYLTETVQIQTDRLKISDGKTYNCTVTRKEN